MGVTNLVVPLMIVLVIVGLAAIAGAVIFGNRYKSGGTRNDKYLCVCCCVASCVCLITAVQIYLMFRAYL